MMALPSRHEVITKLMQPFCGEMRSYFAFVRKTPALSHTRHLCIYNSNLRHRQVNLTQTEQKVIWKSR